LLAMREQSGGTCPADIQASMVPSTLQELLLTRLDQCGDAKQLAQTASVFGRDFSLVHLESVLRQLNDIAGLRELSANLATLVRNGLIYAVHAELSTVKYRFKHILFRDSAYHGLWDRDRQNLHKVVANILRSDSDELIRLQPELIALHLTEAGDYGQAIDHWEKAAKLSAVRSAHRESIHFLESALVALTNLPENAARYSKELKMRMSLAAKFIATEGYGAPKVKAAYQRALELAIQTQDHVAIHRINLGLEGYYFMRAEFDQALALAKGAYQTEGENASTWEVIQPRWAEANVNWHKGNLTHAVLLMNECLEMYSHDLHRPSSVQDPGVMCLCYSAWSYWEKGDAQEAFRRIEQAVLLSQQLGHSFSQGIAHGFLASIHLFTGNLTAALREAKVSQSLCEESGFRVWLAHSRMIKGRALVGLGEIELGLTEMQTAYTLWTDTGAIVTRPLYLALQADAFLNIQQFETAMGLIDEGISIAQATGEHYHKGELLRLKAKALMLSSSSAESLAIAQTLLMDAIALAKFQGKNLFVLRSVIDLLRLPLQAEQKLWAQAELESVVTLLEAMAIAGNDKRFLLPEIIAARQLLDNEKTLGLV
jgi:tetratricopeptide (TPR) repeat protein